MRRAFITGLSGFTGKYLAAELQAAGYEVFGICRQGEPGEKNLSCVDLGDPEAARDLIVRVSPDIVAHLAAVSFVDHKHIEEIYLTNIVGTRNLLQSLSGLENPPNAVLLASSANVYGNTDTDFITENLPPAPANDYAISKLAMEYMAGLYLDRLPIFIVRPFNYTGVGQSLEFLLPKIVDHFSRKAEYIELGNTDISRDFSDVRTVAKSYCRLIERVPTGKIVNICSGRAVSLGEILNIMADISGYKIKVKTNPELIRKNEIKHLRGSNQYLTSLIGKMCQIPLRDTLLWMYQDANH